MTSPGSWAYFSECLLHLLTMDTLLAKENGEIQLRNTVTDMLFLSFILFRLKFSHPMKEADFRFFTVAVS